MFYGQLSGTLTSNPMGTESYTNQSQDECRSDVMDAGVSARSRPESVIAWMVSRSAFGRVDALTGASHGAIADGTAGTMQYHER